MPDNTAPEPTTEISLKGWTLAKVSPESEPLIQDSELAIKLGYANVDNVRRLIRKMEKAKQLGVLCVLEITSGTLGGRPGQAYYLNEKQALKVIARSTTTVADKIMDEVIEVFIAYRKGLLVPVEPAAQVDQVAPPVAIPEVANPQLEAINAQIQLSRIDFNQYLAKFLLADPEISPAHKRSIAVKILETSTKLDLSELKPALPFHVFLTPTQMSKKWGVSLAAIGLAITKLGLRTEEYAEHYKDVNSASNNQYPCYRYNTTAVEKLRQHFGK